MYKSIVPLLLLFSMITLVQAPSFAKENYGTLKVICENENVEIYVDGLLAGKGIVTIEEILVGSHYVKVVSGGYRTIFSKIVDIKEGQQETVVVPSSVTPGRIENQKTEHLQLSSEDKTVLWMKYQAEKKDPWIAAAIPLLFISSVGHAYAGDWGRGLLFLGGKLLCGILMTQTETSYVGYGYYSTRPSSSAQAAAIAWLVLYIWEPIDAFQVAEDYNNRLRNQLGISLAPYQNTLSLKLSYQF